MRDILQAFLLGGILLVCSYLIKLSAMNLYLMNLGGHGWTSGMLGEGKGQEGESDMIGMSRSFNERYNEKLIISKLIVKMNRRDQFVTFCSLKKMTIEHDEPFAIDLNEELNSNGELKEMMTSHSYFIPKVLKIIIKPYKAEEDPKVVDASILSGEQGAQAPWVYGMAFSKEPLTKIEELKTKKLKYFKKSDEEIIFVFDIAGKKATLETGCHEIPELYIGSYFHNLSFILRLEFALLLV